MFTNRQQTFVLWINVFLIALNGYVVTDGDAHPDGERYGVIIDAGSSGSKVMVYKWRNPWMQNITPHIKLIYSNKIRPGIATLADDREDLRNHIVILISEAKSHVDKNEQSATLLAFMATAGVRLLLESRADEIISDVREILQDTALNPFRTTDRTTRILSGEEEGVFQWITVNYLRGYFDRPESLQSVGVLEMGGASTQITFTPEVAILANKFPVSVGGRHTELYSHSFLNYGQDALTRWYERELALEFPRDVIIKDPCMLREDSKEVEFPGRPMLTFKGTGDPLKCTEHLTTYVYQVDPELCSPKPCSIGPFYQPSIPIDLDLFATGVYHKTVEAFGMLKGNGGVISPAQLYMAAQNYCRKDYHAALEETGQNPEYVSSPCLMGLYIYQLLTIAYKVPKDTRQLHIVDQINEEPISWTLGALIYEVEQYSMTLPATPCTSSSHCLSYSSSLLTIICCLSLYRDRNK